ncbi:MAG: M3 family metallopeptidase, partial [Terracidiphilus sp.]
MSVDLANLTGNKEIHCWDAGGAASAEALTAWVGERLAAHETALAALLAVEGPRTPANSLTLYDKAIEQLSLAGAQAGVLNSVATDKAVRDQAQMEAQRVAMAGAALSLNREVYDALLATNLEGASPATKHYVERTLLGYRLSGVDKDKETRDRLQALHEKATMHSLEFSRNIQEGGKTIQARPEELEGLPADFIARHPAGSDGNVTLSTDPPDMQPVMTFASNAALRERMFLAYNTRAYPANHQILLDLLATRQEIATVLGFRSWADLATADQMMGSAANVRTFLAKLNAASREGAANEHNQVLEFVRRRQPDLKEIDIVSRGYWYEQFRRSAFDFDSQSVRPYFPYAQVEAGVLSTAAQLFKVEFRPSAATAWDASVSVFDVIEDGAHVGRFYLDMHPRDGKSKWFSAAPLVSGVRGGALPEAGLICNFPAGDENDPGLLQYSDVVTFFHEFGHLMHAILGGRTEWVGLSGFATEGDFIEVPSQMLEEFFRDEELLQAFAKHYQTGETLPSETIKKMKQAGAFGRADWIRAQLYYTTLSLDLH